MRPIGRVLRPIVETMAEELIEENERITLKEYARLLRLGLWDLMPVEASAPKTDETAFYPLRGDGLKRYARQQHKGPKRYGRWSEI